MFRGNPNGSQALIANAGTTSGEVPIGGQPPVAIDFPAALTSTSCTFQVSRDNATYQALYKDDGTAYTVTCAASRSVALDYAKFLGYNWLKVVMGSAEGGARTLVLTHHVL